MHNVEIVFAMLCCLHHFEILTEIKVMPEKLTNIYPHIYFRYDVHMLLALLPRHITVSTSCTIGDI